MAVCCQCRVGTPSWVLLPDMMIFGKIVPHTHANCGLQNGAMKFSFNIIIIMRFYNYYNSINTCHWHGNVTSVWWHFQIPSVCQQNLQCSLIINILLPIQFYYYLNTDFYWQIFANAFVLQNLWTQQNSAHLVYIWTLGCGVYCWDYRMFCPMLPTFPVTAFLTACS